MKATRKAPKGGLAYSPFPGILQKWFMQEETRLGAQCDIQTVCGVKCISCLEERMRMWWGCWQSDSAKNRDYWEEPSAGLTWSERRARTAEVLGDSGLGLHVAEFGRLAGVDLPILWEREAWSSGRLLHCLVSRQLRNHLSLRSYWCHLEEDGFPATTCRRKMCLGLGEHLVCDLLDACQWASGAFFCKR